MKTSTLPYWLTFVVLVTTAYGGWKVWQVEQARQAASLTVTDVESDSLPPVSEFTLTASNGKPFHSSELQGKVWAASFFFTDCANACLRMNEGIKLLTGSEDLKDVRFVSITCDPENDTPERLAEYADRFGADPEHWVFCTGDMDYIQRVGQDMLHLAVMPKTHSQRLIVVDRAGHVRGSFDIAGSAQVAAARELLLKCLAEKAPAPPQVTEKDTRKNGDS